MPVASLTGSKHWQSPPFMACEVQHLDVACLVSKLFSSVDLGVEVVQSRSAAAQQHCLNSLPKLPLLRKCIHGKRTLMAAGKASGAIFFCVLVWYADMLDSAG